MIMRRWHKIVTTIWTTMLVSPFLFMLLAYLRMECGELDPCRTGGSMPYAPEAFVLILALSTAQAAFLAMIWWGVPETQD
jgi:hypothetical protein